MAKAGGKAEDKGKGKAKRAGKKDDEPRSKAGKAPKSQRPGKGGVETREAGKAKSVAAEKTRRPKGAQRLVEEVAAQIVAEEYERAVGSLKPASDEVVVPEDGTAADESVKASEAKASDKKADTGKPDAKKSDKKSEAKKADADEHSAQPEPGAPMSELLRAPLVVDLAEIATDATPGVSSREKAEAELPALAERLEELQERLFAAARGGDSKRRVLLILQGMDTSGKGGTVRHVVSELDPNGTRLTAFKAPTEEERAHDFLWRIRNGLPTAGEIGIFDRSQYEDVLIARVRKLALPMVIGKRYQLINKFEQNLVADGAVLVKCFLHISSDEQRRRLLARLDNPEKVWKYNPGDVDERALWPQYQQAYKLALEKCSTDDAPWYVIPADHKWYRNYAITRLLVEALERIDPAYPPGDFDIEVERKRVLDS